MTGLTLAIITGGQPDLLKRALSSAEPLRAASGDAMEFLVLLTAEDPASEKEAKAHGAAVYRQQWNDDFAMARNRAAELAEYDVILMLDTDEYFPEMDKQKAAELYEKTIALIRDHPDAVGQLRIVNLLHSMGKAGEAAASENREWVSRIYDRRYFLYEGRIHEQLVSRDGKDFSMMLSPLSVFHTGYDLTGEERIAKAERNRRLLLSELAEVTTEKGDEDPQIPYLYYQLGKASYTAGEYARAAEEFEKALVFDLDEHLEYVIDMVETYGYALLNSGQAEKALGFTGIYDAFSDSADFVFLMGLIYMNNALFDRAVGEFKKATGFSTSKNSGVTSYAAWYNIGVIYECLGDKETAHSWYEKCGDYPPAKERMASP